MSVAVRCACTVISCCGCKADTTYAGKFMRASANDGASNDCLEIATLLFQIELLHSLFHVAGDESFDVLSCDINLCRSIRKNIQNPP